MGAGVIGSHVERRLDAQPQLGLEPVGYLDSDPPPADMVPDRQAPVLGSPADLGRVVADTGARHVVLGFSSAPDHELIPLVRECEARGLEVSLVPRLFESVNVRVALDHLGGLPLFGLHSIDPKGWQFTIKHVFDRAVAATMLILLSPLLLAIAAAVRLSSPGPILFRQLRIGRDGRRFEMLKFRSMELQPPTPEPHAEQRADAADRHRPGRHRGHRPAHAHRRLPPPHLAGRAAAAPQRAARRHEPRRPAPRAARSSSTSSATGSPATRTATASGRA